jgi:hypothetical protein
VRARWATQLHPPSLLHGVLRQHSDFDVMPRGAEYRALRAVVLRLWRVRLATSLALGLFIAREVVTAHGGLVSVTSTAEGTAFTVRRPR